MKVVYISNCLECPYCELLGYAWCKLANNRRIGNEKDADIIAEWCPLEDYTGVIGVNGVNDEESHCS